MNPDGPGPLSWCHVGLWKRFPYLGQKTAGLKSAVIVDATLEDIRNSRAATYSIHAEETLMIPAALRSEDCGAVAFHMYEWGDFHGLAGEQTGMRFPGLPDAQEYRVESISLGRVAEHVSGESAVGLSCSLSGDGADVWAAMKDFDLSVHFSALRVELPRMLEGLDCYPSHGEVVTEMVRKGYDLEDARTGDHLAAFQFARRTQGQGGAR